jgi:capsular exopolysaccharide synthesis family protein
MTTTGNGMNGDQHPLAPYLMRPPRSWTGTLPPQPERGIAGEVWALLGRQWKVIAATTAVLVGVTALYCILVTPVYLGSANVLIEGHAPEVLGGQQIGEAQSPFLSTKYDYYQTQFSLLRSPTLARRVIEELGLASDPRFTGPRDGSEQDTGVTPALISKYQRQLTVTPIRSTRLVSVEFESADPNLSADVANAHAKLFVRTSMERIYDSTEQIRKFLEGKLEDLQVRMNEADRNLMKFQSEHRLMPLDATKDVAGERLTDLSKRLTTAEGDRIAIEAQYQLVKDRKYDSLPAVLSSALVQKLREDYDRLEVEYALLAMKFKPTYPRLKQLRGQLEHAKNLLEQETSKVVKGVEASYLAAKDTVDRLRNEIEAHRESLLKRKDAEGEFMSLVSQVETTRAIHDNLLGRIKALNVAGDANTSNMSVAEAATPAQWPASPATRLNLLISFATGLLLGGGIAFLRDSLDPTVRDAKDIQRSTGLGTLAVIPDFDTVLPHSAGARIRQRVAHTQHKAAKGLKRIGFGGNGRHGHGVLDPSQASPPLVLGNGGTLPPPAEAYRTLRTSLLLSRAVSPRVILIASAAGGEGKTTTAVNTAAALASCGATVLLIDADLRRPCCHHTLGVESEPGLSEFLTGQIETHPIQTTHIPNLSLLAAGQQVSNPTELLTSWLMCKLVQEAREKFDFVVLDSPPLLAVSDGLLLANLADGVVFVAEQGKSRSDRIRLAVQRLHTTGALPLGAVLNRGHVETEFYQYGTPARRVAVEIVPPARTDAQANPAEDSGEV